LRTTSDPAAFEYIGLRQHPGTDICAVRYATLWHPFNPLEDNDPSPLIFRRGDGVFWKPGTAGRILEHFVVVVMRHGHGHPSIARRLAAQPRASNTSVCRDFHTKPAEKLASPGNRSPPCGSIFSPSEDRPAVESH